MTGIDGSQIDEAGLSFNPLTYHFQTSAGLDVTNNIFRADKKRIVPDFDDVKENNRMYAEHYSSTHAGAEPPPLDDRSIWQIWASNVDDSIRSSVPNPTQAVNTAIIFGIVALAVVFLIKTK